MSSSQLDSSPNVITSVDSGSGIGKAHSIIVVPESMEFDLGQIQVFV
ncbi:MAG: hypothetical protein H8J66_13075 [Nitrospira sp.]|nr:hypothetical protein [Nitrospira sp.]